MSDISARLRKGFTLLELIVVIVILGILAAIAIPTFSAVISKSKDASSVASLRSLDRNITALAALDKGSRSSVVAADITTAISELRLSGAAANATAAPGTEKLPIGEDDRIGYVANAAGYSLAMRSTSGACLMLVNASNTTTLFKSSTGDCTADRALAGKQSTDTDVSAASTPGVIVPPAAVAVNKPFSASGATQSWIVPDTGVYTLSATGARGGSSYLIDPNTAAILPIITPGGTPAKITGTFTLTKGDTIQVLVGKAGGNISQGYARGGGGGGGTFIYNQTKSTLLIAAGGGGGAGQYTTSFKKASLTTSGNSGSYQTSAGNPGGSNGNAGSSNYSGGGAGFSGSSADTSWVLGAFSFLAGGSAGATLQSIGTDGADGGFGGGGGSFIGGGGGGGYSGGGAGSWSYSGDGGGGGSFNGGTAPTAELDESTTGAGAASIVSK